jgi:hypothetical protein
MVSCSTITEAINTNGLIGDNETTEEKEDV